MADAPKVTVYCDCGKEHVFEQTWQRRVEICSGCGSILRVPAYERPGAGEARAVEARDEDASLPKPARPAKARKAAPLPQAQRAAARPPRAAQRKPKPKAAPSRKKPPARPAGTAVDMDNLGGRKRRRRSRGGIRGDLVPLPDVKPGYLLGAFGIVYVFVALLGPRIGLQVNWITALPCAMVPFVAIGTILWGRYLGVVLGAAAGILIVLLLAGLFAKVARTGGWFSGMDRMLPVLLNVLAAGLAGYYAAQIATERPLLNGPAAGVLWAFLVYPITAKVFSSGKLHGYPLASFAPAGATALFYGLIAGAVGAYLWHVFSEM